MNDGKFGILVGGGPAPGINGVIAAATIEAINHGYEVVGLLDGYRWITQGDTGHTVALTREAVRGIHALGGTVLKTARVNPGADPSLVARAVCALTELGINRLVCIGGDDTTFGASKIAEAAAGAIQVTSVPKTIDNDLPLPGSTPTFGFETARAAGTREVEALMEDARSTGRWYIAVAMGRTSGSLALGMCSAAYAALAIIPEEFERPTMDLIADTIAGSILKRKLHGHDDGVAIVAEGLIEKFDQTDVEKFEATPRDAFGHVRLADIPIGPAVRQAAEKRLNEFGLGVGFVVKDIGYELRCAPPNPFDIEYTRALGSGAVRYLLAGGSGALITLNEGRVEPLALSELLDPATGRIRVRRVDTAGDGYQTARRFMTRLERADLESPSLEPLASLAGISPGAFAARFGNVIEATAPLRPFREHVPI
jgi:6-phosphofructokinase 1